MTTQVTQQKTPVTVVMKGKVAYVSICPISDSCPRAGHSEPPYPVFMGHRLTRLTTGRCCLTDEHSVAMEGIWHSHEGLGSAFLAS
jgi:hypothetical protein